MNGITKREIIEVTLIMIAFATVLLLLPGTALAADGAWYHGLTLERVAFWIVETVGAASLLSLAITKIAGITPNTKDDQWAGAIARWISRAQALVDRLALNPDTSTARKART